MKTIQLSDEEAKTLKDLLNFVDSYDTDNEKENVACHAVCAKVLKQLEA